MYSDQPFRELLPLTNEEVIAISYYAANINAPFHYHAEYELVFFLNCKGLEFTIGSINEKTSDTELILIAPGMPHGWRFTNKDNVKGRIISINFSEQFLTDASKGDDIRLLFEAISILFLSPKAAHLLSKKLAGMINLKKKAFKVELLSMLKYLAGTTDKRTIFRPGKKNISDSAELTSLDNFLKENYKRQLSLTEVCNFTGMSQASFNRYINKHTGMSFVSYFNNIKLAYAARYLSETDKRVALIAESSGFSNLANFNRMFKKKYGITPLHYRELFFGRKRFI